MSMKLGTQTGSLINHLFSRATIGAPQPEVGMGCTILGWTDRNPATIVGVEKFKGGLRAGQVKAVLIQQDDAERVDSNGMSESQEYIFKPNTKAAVVRCPVNKKGVFMCGSSQLRIGERDKYYDFSF